MPTESSLECDLAWMCESLQIVAKICPGCKQTCGSHLGYRCPRLADVFGAVRSRLFIVFRDDLVEHSTGNQVTKFPDRSRSCKSTREDKKKCAMFICHFISDLFYKKTQTVQASNYKIWVAVESFSFNETIQQTTFLSTTGLTKSMANHC